MAKKSDAVIHEEERRKTIKLQKEQQDAMHEQKMVEFKFRRESERIFHGNEMERFRIKNAEAQKMQIRREQFFQKKQESYKGGG